MTEATAEAGNSDPEAPAPHRVCKFSVPGAVARQAPKFGDATGYGTIGGEYFSLGAGTDITPLLHGLTDDLCQAPHCGYVIAGDLVVRYTDGSEDTCTGGDVSYWPPSFVPERHTGRSSSMSRSAWRTCSIAVAARSGSHSGSPTAR